MTRGTPADAAADGTGIVCSDDGQCDDGDPCTNDHCGVGGMACLHVALKDCTSAQGPDGGDSGADASDVLDSVGTTDVGSPPDVAQPGGTDVSLVEPDGGAADTQLDTPSDVPLEVEPDGLVDAGADIIAPDVVDAVDADASDIVDIADASANSCVGKCGKYVAADPCHCDAACVGFGDCCSDWSTLCPKCGSDGDCDDGNVCTTDHCDPKTGCTSKLAANLCDDGNPCTVDSCDPASGCASSPDDSLCNDGNPCTDDACDAKNGCTASPNASTCDDNNACTADDVCTSGVCAGVDSVVCTASDECHVNGVCDPKSGKCSNPPAPAGTACDDGSACTISDTCKNGACVGLPLDGSPCTYQATNPCHTGKWICVNGTPACGPSSILPDGVACDPDGEHFCHNGLCLGCTPLVPCDLSTGDGCHLGAIDCSTGLAVCSDSGSAAPDKTPCGTGESECASGKCTPCKPNADTGTTTYVGWFAPDGAKAPPNLGDAFDSLHDTDLQATCLTDNSDANWNHKSGMSRTFTSTYYKNHEELHKAMSISASASYSDTGVFEGEFNAAYSTSSSHRNDSVYLVLDVAVTYEDVTLNTKALSTAALAALSADPEQFVAKCGDRYVANVTRGAGFRAIYEFHDVEDGSAESTEISASVTTGDFTSSASLSASYASSMSQLTTKYSVTLNVQQYGTTAQPTATDPASLQAYAKCFGAAASADCPNPPVTLDSSRIISFTTAPYYPIANFPAGKLYPDPTPALLVINDDTYRFAYDNALLVIGDIEDRLNNWYSLADPSCQSYGAAITDKLAELEAFRKSVDQKMLACRTPKMCGPDADCTAKVPIPTVEMPLLDLSNTKCGPQCASDADSFAFDARGYCLWCKWNDIKQFAPPNGNSGNATLSTCRHMRHGATVQGVFSVHAQGTGMNPILYYALELCSGGVCPFEPNWLQFNGEAFDFPPVTGTLTVSPAATDGSVYAGTTGIDAEGTCCTSGEIGQGAYYDTVIKICDVETVGGCK